VGLEARHEYLAARQLQVTTDDLESFRRLAAIVLPAVHPEFLAASNCSAFTSEGILVACSDIGVSISTDTPPVLTIREARALAACLLAVADEQDKIQETST
jgi:hypothetical protein